MKLIRHITAVLLLTSAVACSKYKVGSPNDFTVTTNGSSFNTKDTVTFTFNGNPDYIIFYSGEPGKNYEYRNTMNVEPDSAVLNFSTNTTAASATTQPLTANRVSLLVSTDFSGSMDAAEIKQANWRNITDSAKWATSTTTVASGPLKVHNYRQGSQPVYFAYRYVSDTVKSNYQARKWTIASFSLKCYANGTFNALAGGNSGTSIPFTTAGFTSKSLADSTNNWVFGNTSLTFNAPGNGALPNEDWTISRPFDFTSYNPDPGTSLKTPAALVTSYKYQFTTKGTYKVTFVAKNQNVEKAREVVRQITLEIK